ncbi:MAG: dihydroneopterin aldolase, partial [Chitinophagaceae bacterium]|nr:dihydroneopterin aldolase [Chitinophagaceae bacterium]
MISIELHDVHLHAFHGIYEGEEKIGNPYIINLDVKYEEGSADFDDISNTINYVDLYEIIKQRMQIPTGLLEKVCESIIRRIKHQYPFIKEVSLSLYKLQPPLLNFQGKVGVT